MNFGQDNFFKEGNNSNLSLSLENDSFVKGNQKGQGNMDLEFDEDAEFLKVAN